MSTDEKASEVSVKHQGQTMIPKMGPESRWFCFLRSG
jgi:hypothetical protein